MLKPLIRLVPVSLGCLISMFSFSHILQIVPWLSHQLILLPLLIGCSYGILPHNVSYIKSFGIDVELESIYLTVNNARI